MGPDGLTAVGQRTPAFRCLALRRWPILDIPDVSKEHNASILKGQVLRNVENHPPSYEASVGLERKLNIELVRFLESDRPSDIAAVT